MPDLKNALKTAPERVRATTARGLFSATSGRRIRRAVDRDGGDKGAGFIGGVSVIAAGEALGHGMWIDSTLLDQVAQGLEAAPAGIKSRFSHPSLSSDGIGKHLGRVTGPVKISRGRVIAAGLHFSQAAHNSPDGDLAGYVMDLAEDDPEAFGVSIVFTRDLAAERAFMLENGAVEKDDEFYGPYLDLENFQSPDPKNTDNLPHARLHALHAADVVDDPAANPNGLFHRSDVAQQAEALAGYALELTDDAPEVSALDVHPDRVRGFVQRYLNSNGLRIVKAEAPQQKEPEQMADETTPQAPTPTENSVDPATVQNAYEIANDDARDELRRYMSAFGDRGAGYFAEALEFEDAAEKELAALRDELAAARAENEQLRRQVDELAGDDEPVSFDADDTPENDKPRGFAGMVRISNN